MRLSRTLSLYVLREALQFAGIGLLAVGAVLLTQNFLRELDDLAGLGFVASDVLAVLWCLLLMLAAYAVPVAFLFGVLVAVGRLSSDSEVTAMRALGVSLAQILVPFLVLGLIFSAATAVLLVDVEPAARRRLRAVLGDIAARGGIIQPGSFSPLDREGKRLLFVEERQGGNQLEGVVISDRTDPLKPFTVVAERGRFSFDAEAAVAALELSDGDLHFEPEDPDSSSYQHIAFQSFRYAFDMSEVVGAGFHRLHPREMSTGEIRAVLAHFDATGEAPEVVRVRERSTYEIQLQRRMALPAAPLLFAALGVPLGLRRTRGARSWGALLCVGLVFGYYMLLSLGTYVANTGALPTWTALWIPNAVFAALALALLARAGRAET